MILSLNDFRKKVLGCFMGKNIGGTLGAPMEWKRQVNNVSFYIQELKGEALPNDDLDLQLVWLSALERQGLDVNSQMLGEYWLSYIGPHWSEYGYSKINLRAGLMPPLSGIENNCYKDSCGAFIRSEIWACIAPGCPAIAAKYAYEDAAVDHGNGEGMYAEIFCAVLESAAFVEKDVYRLIDIGLSYIPEDCAISKAVKCAIDSRQSGKTWLEARDEMLSRYRGHYVKNAGISKEDVEKGFSDGKLGFDVPANIGMIIIGWLYGEGDFGKSLCTAVNCGEDTDCTGATLGSIMGIIHGIDAIPDRWTKPIGRSIKTMSLNLGDFWEAALNIDELAERIEAIARQAVLRYRQDMELSEIKATDLSDLDYRNLFSAPGFNSLYRNLNGPSYSFEYYDVLVDYIDGPYIKRPYQKRLRIKIVNKYKYAENVNIKWYLHEGWSVSPAKRGKIFAYTGENEIECILSAEDTDDITFRFVMELTVDGRHTVMLVPVVLQSAGYRSSADK
ncbi:MAG: ADP-ribosylglycohydrolase family protein [Ruminiclostridium sp.]|nr:ADP-ribosylglycohydrolase family protein [Ruminiclostridium sp.]